MQARDVRNSLPAIGWRAPIRSLVSAPRNLLSASSIFERCELKSANLRHRDLAILADAPNAPEHLLRTQAGEALSVRRQRLGSRLARVNLESGVWPTTAFLLIEKDLAYLGGEGRSSIRDIPLKRLVFLAAYCAAVIR